MMKRTGKENKRDLYAGKGVRASAAVLLLALMSAGCSKQTEQPVESSKEISIPIILTVDSSTGIRNEEKLINTFNRLYDGKWQADVEWIMETEEEYRQNLKRQNVTDTLPAVITDLRMLPSFYQMMIQDDRIEELLKYIEEDEEWQEMKETYVQES